LHFQSWNTSKLLLIIRHQNQSSCSCMCRNPHIVVANDLTFGLQCCADCAVRCAGLRWQSENGQKTHELGQLPGSLLAELTFFESVQEFAVGDDRNRRLPRLEPIESR
jgi:hypothetical protein